MTREELFAPALEAEDRYGVDACERYALAGRLFRLRLRRSQAARDDALAGVRRRPDGRWQVRIGGRMRGRTLVFASRQAANEAVGFHYNQEAMKWLKQKSV